MFLIAIVASQKQTNQIIKEIEQDITGLKLEIVPITSNSIENIRNIKFDIVILYDKLDKLEGNMKCIRDILNNSKYLLLNGDVNMDNSILKDINVKIITFGLNQKSTITASSIGENEIIICIQRAFKNMESNIVEPQEVKRELKQNNIKSIYNSLIKEAIINVYTTKNRNKFQ